MKLRRVWLLVGIVCVALLAGCGQAVTGQQGESTPVEAYTGTVSTSVPAATPTADIVQSLAALDTGGSLTFQEALALMKWLEDQRPFNRRYDSRLATPGPTMTDEEQDAADNTFATLVEPPFKKKLLKCKLSMSQGWVESSGEYYPADGSYVANIFMYDPWADFLPTRPSFMGKRFSSYPDLELGGLTAKQAEELKPGMKIQFEGDIADADTENGVLTLKNVHYNILPDERPDSKTELSDSDPAALEITFSRTMCFGKCPVYKMTITGDGKIIFTGQKYTRVAEATGQLTQDQSKELLRDFDRANFFALAPYYPPDATDLPDTIICIHTRSKSACVRANDSSYTAPRRLGILQAQIYRMTQVEQWAR
jgi:Domain of unknown function (DUF6438)